MVKNDLIDRYIYAVTKHMKSAMKKDVAAELETIIQDMLEERCEDVTPTERDIKVVLIPLPMNIHTLVYLVVLTLP